jgi:hypothetical protein
VMIDELMWRLDMTGQNGTSSPSATPLVASEDSTLNSDPQGNYPLDVQTAWLKLSGMSGFQRLKRIVVRAKPGTTQGGLTITMYADFDETTSVGSASWTAAQATAVPQAQFEMHVPAQKSSAASFRYKESSSEFGSPSIVQGLTLRGTKKGQTTKNLGAGARK